MSLASAVAIGISVSTVAFLILWSISSYINLAQQGQAGPTSKQIRNLDENLRKALSQLAAAERHIEVLTYTVELLMARLEGIDMIKPLPPDALIPPPAPPVTERMIFVTGQAKGFPQLGEFEIRSAIEAIRAIVPWRVKHVSGATTLRILHELEEGARSYEHGRVLVFICHGGPSELYLHDENVADSSWLSDQINRYNIEGVIFASCWSDSLTEAVLNHGAEWVLVADDKIALSEALGTVSAFVSRLAAGRATGDAIHYARSLMKRSETRNMVDLRGNHHWIWNK